MLWSKTFLFVTALGGATLICPLCEKVVARAASASDGFELQLPDTATARLHISGMTCATCPVTARLALKRLAGVYDAKVTLDDSLGVVRYDPRRVSPAQIAAHLTEFTGYKARVLPDSAKPTGSQGYARANDRGR